MAKRPGFRHIEARYNKEVDRNILAKPGVHDFIVILDNLKANFNPENFPDIKTVSILQFGETESLNVSNAQRLSCLNMSVNLRLMLSMSADLL